MTSRKILNIEEMIPRDEKGRFMKGNIPPMKLFLNEEKVIELYKKFKTAYKVAEYFNCSQRPILRILKEKDIPIYGFQGFKKEEHPMFGKHLKKETIEKIIKKSTIPLDLKYIVKKYIEEDYSIREIALELGVSSGTIKKRLNARGIEKREIMPQRLREKFSRKKSKEEKLKIKQARNKQIMFPHSNETKVKMGNASKKRWQNPEYRKMNIEHSLKGLIKRPTSYEKKISDLCIEYNLPFIYTGNGTFLIGFKNPDFINEKGKVVIEVFHSYFKIRDYGSVEEYKKQRAEHFTKYGYKTIFISEDEILDKNWEEACLNKIIDKKIS